MPYAVVMLASCHFLVAAHGQPPQDSALLEEVEVVQEEAVRSGAAGECEYCQSRELMSYDSHTTRHRTEDGGSVIGGHVPRAPG